MKSQRLTKEIKGNILDQMEKELFAKRWKAQRISHERFSDEVYEDMYSIDDKKMMDGAPKGAFNYLTRKAIKAACTGFEYDYMNLKNARPFFADHSNNATYINADNVLNDVYRKIMREDSKIKSDIKSLRDTTAAILNSVSTVKKLVEIWPEVAEYLPEDNAIENLPAIPVGDLNAMIASLKNNAVEVAA